MQKIEIHPVSLLAGAALAVLAFVAMAPAPPPNTTPTYGGPIPARNMVQIQEGTSFVVPAGKLFVLTGLGTRDSWVNNQVTGRVYLSVNGITEVSALSELLLNNQGLISPSTSIKPIPLGFAVPAGATIEVSDDDMADQEARAWGYLDRT